MLLLVNCSVAPMYFFTTFDRSNLSLMHSFHLSGKGALFVEQHTPEIPKKTDLTADAQVQASHKRSTDYLKWYYYRRATCKVCCPFCTGKKDIINYNTWTYTNNIQIPGSYHHILKEYWIFIQLSNL